MRQTSWQMRRRAWANGVTRVTVGAAIMAGLAACAGGPSPETYAEAALRADARDAVLAPDFSTDPDEQAPLDTAAVSRELRSTGRLRAGVYLVHVVRPARGVDAQIAFHPAVGTRAAITGDVSVPRAAVRATIRALTQHGIQVTAMDATPTAAGTLASLRVWALGDPTALAHGLSAGLDRIAGGTVLATETASARE